MVTERIKFGTDGWRAIIAQDFTVFNVARVSKGLATWLFQQEKQPVVVVGHDCRFGGLLFAETVAKVLCANGVKVLLAKGFISTPMISYGVLALKAHQGVVITASHNPPTYNGYKLKGAHGGPSSPKDIAAVEALIPDEVDMETLSLSAYEANGLLEYVALEDMYVSYLQTKFDFESLNNSPFKMAYDAMYGAGQNVIKRLLPNAVLIHCDDNPGFKGQAPEPLDKNLKELAHTMATTPELKIGLATDGDADRIGLYNGKGEFIDSHHIILLLIHYMVKYKQMTGKVAIAFSVTPRVYKMCEHYGLEVTTTKIGFKEIATVMVKEDVLLGGEESGGIAVKGHIPERDGIWMGLIIWEFMAKSGKSLDELIEEVYDIVGPFKFERSDLHITEEMKQNIIANCKAGNYKAFGDYEVKEVKTIDGFKYFFDENRWMMIRPSGTEPVLRTYAEAPTLEEVRKILKMTEETICK